MSLRIVYGKAGSGKSKFCFDEVAKNINNGKKIYIITPEQFSFTAENKLMESVGSKAVVNAEVITFNRMAYRVMNEIGGIIKTNLSKCGKSMLVYSILNSKQKHLNFLGKNDENIDIAIRSITEFKKHGVSVDILRSEINKIQDLELKTKLEDMQIIYEEFQRKIEENYIDETDLLSMLSENIDKVESFKNSEVYIDEFAGFTTQEYDVIRKLIDIANRVTFTVCTDSLSVTKNPDSDIFYPNKVTVSKILRLLENDEKVETVNMDEYHRFKSDELKFIEQNLYKNRYEIYDTDVKDVKLFLAKNQYSEIENVARNIIKLVKEYNYRYKDIAIITKNINTYSSLARAIFDKYDIPVFIDEKRDLNQNILVQYLLSILEVFTKNWSYEAVINYIKTGFCDIEEDEIFKLENYCVKYGIKQNKWKKDFTYGITDENKEQIERLNEIRKKIVNPLLKLKSKLDENNTGENVCKSIYNFLVEQNVNQILNNKINHLEEKGLLDIVSEYKSSAKVIVDVLDEIYLIFKEDKMRLDKFNKILKIGLKNSGLGKIPKSQDQVIFGDVERSRSHKVKAIFIIGLNDGVFPSNNKDEGFLNDADREVLKQDGIELAKGSLENLYDENFNIYKAFTTAEEKLFLYYSSANSEGASLRASSLISKIKKIFPKIEEESDILEKKNELFTKDTTYQELLDNIKKIKDGKIVEDIWYDVYEYYNQDEKFGDKLKQNTEYIGYRNLPENIKKENIDRLYGEKLVTSVSKLERYSNCPFSYFLQYGLKLKEKEELKVKSLDTGSFMHEVLDSFFERMQYEGYNIHKIEENEIENLISKIVDEKLQEESNYIFVSTKKYKLLVNRLKRIIIKSLKYIIESLKNSSFNVYGTEIKFDEKSKCQPIIVDVGSDKKVEIIGKIDRIDIGTLGNNKYVRVIDYKSSVKNLDLNDIYYGLQLQLITYLDVACKIEDFIPAGVLYFSLIEQLIADKKKISTEEIENRIKKNFKMKGLILSDVNVVKMHDSTLEKGYSDIVPAFIDKDGNVSLKSSSVASKEEFEKLQKYIYKTIREISDEIFSGNIELKPYYKEKNTPCKYCSYKSMCGFNSGLCQKQYRYMDKMTDVEIWERIDEKLK